MRSPIMRRGWHHLSPFQIRPPTHSAHLLPHSKLQAAPCVCCLMCVCACVCTIFWFHCSDIYFYENSWISRAALLLRHIKTLQGKKESIFYTKLLKRRKHHFRQKLWKCTFEPDMSRSHCWPVLPSIYHGLEMKIYDIRTQPPTPTAHTHPVGFRVDSA